VRLAAVTILVAGGSGLNCLAGRSTQGTDNLVGIFVFGAAAIAFSTAAPAIIAIAAVQDRRLWWGAVGVLTICVSVPALVWFALIGIGDDPTDDQLQVWLGWVVAVPILGGTSAIVLILVVEWLLRQRSAPPSGWHASPMG
jgi:hypothetical protein